MLERMNPEAGMVGVREIRKVNQFDRQLDFGGSVISEHQINSYFDARRLTDAAQDKRMYITIRPDGTAMRITYQNFTAAEAEAIEAEVLALGN